APHVLLAPEVVARDAPARARELEPDDREQQDADERMDGQQLLDPEQGRPLHRQQNDENRGNDGGELFVARAATGQQPEERAHRSSEAHPPGDPLWIGPTFPLTRRGLSTEVCRMAVPKM